MDVLELYKLLAAHPYIDIDIKLETWESGLRITVTNYLGDVRRYCRILPAERISKGVGIPPVVDIIKHMIEEVEK